jgi:hypothetical protein
MKKMCMLLVILFASGLVGSVNLCIAQYVDDDDPAVDDNGYIMSWLILDPFISDPVGSAISCEKDYFEDQGGEANIMPREGDKVTIAEPGSDHEWVRLNFADLKDMGQIPAAVGGNEFDILEWGGQAPTNTQEYMVTYLKWDSSGTVKITIGVDDASEAYFNGEEIIRDPKASQNWGAGNSGNADVDVEGGEWNVLVVGCYEAAGEWGITVQVDTIPDEVNSAGPEVLFAVEPASKLSTTWGSLKK